MALGFYKLDLSFFRAFDSTPAPKAGGRPRLTPCELSKSSKSPAFTSLFGLCLDVSGCGRPSTGSLQKPLQPICAVAVLLLIASLSFVGVASAQEPPRTFRVPFHTDGVILLDAKANDKPAVPVAQEPKPAIRVPHFNRKAFIAEVSLLGAAKTADAITTRQVLDRGGWENNPVFGRHPSPAKQAGINVGIFGAQAGLFYLAEHNRHAWVRWTGRALITNVIVEHAQLAACNAGIDTHSPVIQNCGPLMPF